MQELQCSMNVKVRFVRSHLNYFLDGLEVLSKGRGESFHRESKTMKKSNKYVEMKTCRPITPELEKKSY